MARGDLRRRRWTHDRQRKKKARDKRKAEEKAEIRKESKSS